jgi:putative tricarboxylic transport membrane protein
MATFHDSSFKGFSMRRWERVAAAFLIFLGLGSAVLAYRMGFGDLRQPGPGFFPFWLSTFLAVLAFIYYFTKWGLDSKPGRLWERGEWVRPSLAALAMFVYTLIMGELGFFSATFLLFLAWLIIIEREKWLTIGLVSVVGTLTLYLVFTVFLKVPLPKGLLF